tara:strand:- start:260 stop:631 length:372 start_codon:yes stop_codon:yes gene_type:complete
MKEALEVAVLDILAPIALISSVLFIWFKTDFLLSYLGILGFKFKGFEEYSIENPDSTLFEFLACKNITHKFKFFIFKLLSCVFCLSAWLCLCVSLFNGLKFIGIYYVFSLLLFKVMENKFFEE